jgi:hypothetical protein
MADRSNQKLLQRFENPDRVIETYEADQVNEAYADGFGRTWTGPQVVKMEIFRMVNVSDPSPGKPSVVEQREVFMRLTVPTPALLEYCLNVLTGMGATLASLEGANRETRKLITDALARANDIKL